VKLNTMRFSLENRRISAKLYGRALQLDSGTGASAVASFIQALKSSPLFLNANLRNVDRVILPDGPGESFEATFDVILAPDLPSPPALAEGDQEVRP
jgi:hypothetical protein